jgi:hypothetical protein
LTTLGLRMGLVIWVILRRDWYQMMKIGCSIRKSGQVVGRHGTWQMGLLVKERLGDKVEI